MEQIFTTLADVQRSVALTITASVNAAGIVTNYVWYDLQPNFGGMGVGLKNGPSDSDQIAGTDVLTLKFTSTVSGAPLDVTLKGVATLFYNDHTPFGTGFANSGGRQESPATR